MTTTVVLPPDAGMALGKRKPKLDPRTFQLANYLTEKVKLPPVVSRRSWLDRMRKWPMLGNDKVGCCTCASAAHMVRVWTRQADGKGRTVTLAEEDVLGAYAGLTGYDPRDPRTDQGASMLDALNYWRHVGVGGHKILGYAATEPGNKDHVRIAINTFGGLYVGVGLPVTAQTQTVWSVPPGGAATGTDAEPWSWGGHALNIVSYSSQDLTCITWGRVQRMTWSFLMTYCDEAYAVLSEDWTDDKNLAKSGFDIGALRAHLTALRSA